MQIAERVFAEIAARFPELRMERDANAPVEISVNLPIQPGLKQDVWLCLQNNDELHLAVSNFWLEWFPCTDAAIADAYRDAVIGYLAGTYRVLEHYRGKRCVKAQLQVPGEDGWITIGTTSHTLLAFPWRRSVQEVRNV
jgi:hypothetical protein